MCSYAPTNVFAGADTIRYALFRMLTKVDRVRNIAECHRFVVLLYITSHKHGCLATLCRMTFAVNINPCSALYVWRLLFAECQPTRSEWLQDKAYVRGGSGADAGLGYSTASTSDLLNDVIAWANSLCSIDIDSKIYSNYLHRDGSPPQTRSCFCTVCGSCDLKCNRDRNVSFLTPSF